MSEFRLGDVVTLKSGGVKMTVEDVGLGVPRPDGTIDCVWLADNGLVQREAFLTATLMLAEEGAAVKWSAPGNPASFEESSHLELAGHPQAPPPIGYRRLPLGTLCRCPRLWNNGDGTYSCCETGLA